MFYSLGNSIMPDLDEPSYFTTEGASGRQYVEHQAPWNRTLLAFVYEPRTPSVATAVMCIDVKRVIRTLRTLRPSRWLGSKPPLPLRFRRAFVTGKVRQLAYVFLLAPRLPKPRHFLWPVRHLKSRDYL